MAAGGGGARRSLIFMEPIVAFNFLRTLGNRPDLLRDGREWGRGGGWLWLCEPSSSPSSPSEAAALLVFLAAFVPTLGRTHALWMASIREQTRSPPLPRRRCSSCLCSSGHGEGFGSLRNPAVMKASRHPRVTFLRLELNGGGREGGGHLRWLERRERFVVSLPPPSGGAGYFRGFFPSRHRSRRRLNETSTSTEMPPRRRPGSAESMIPVS